MELYFLSTICLHGAHSNRYTHAPGTAIPMFIHSPMAHSGTIIPMPIHSPMGHSGTHISMLIHSPMVHRETTIPLPTHRSSFSFHYGHESVSLRVDSQLTTCYNIYQKFVSIIKNFNTCNRHSPPPNRRLRTCTALPQFL